MPATRRAMPAPPLRINPQAVSSSVAPSCPTVRSQPPPPQPPKKIPAIPKATDLPSVINAVNQLIMIQNNYAMYPPQRWVETNRVTVPVRIFNPDDDQQWVDVERITNLTFQDTLTDGLFNWDY